MPLAIRLFLTVLLTTLVIATISLGVLHWTMQKNFARYVADVEMQKLDRLIANLGNVYTVYHDWGMPFRRRFYKLKGTQHLMIMIACLSGGCAVSMILPYNNVILMTIPY
jgi:two-component system sensor histidine kinase BaeS